MTEGPASPDMARRAGPRGGASPGGVRSVQQILQGADGILQSLRERSLELLSLEETLGPHLDAPFTVISFREGVLTLAAPSGAFASRIRYRQRDILAALKRSGLEVASLKVKVRPVRDKPPAVR